MSRIAILGASGGLGTQLVTTALEHGFEVSALVRNPEKITRANYNLTLIEGDAGSGENIQAAVEGCRFVLSAMGSAPKPVTRPVDRQELSPWQTGQIGIPPLRPECFLRTPHHLR